MCSPRLHSQNLWHVSRKPGVSKRHASTCPHCCELTTPTREKTSCHGQKQPVGKHRRKDHNCCVGDQMMILVCKPNAMDDRAKGPCASSCEWNCVLHAQRTCHCLNQNWEDQASSLGCCMKRHQVPIDFTCHFCSSVPSSS